MNDNINKNLNMKNLEDSELEQVSGGSNRERVVDVLFCKECGKIFAHEMRGQYRPGHPRVCNNCGSVDKIVWKSEKEYNKIFGK